MAKKLFVNVEKLPYYENALDFAAHVAFIQESGKEGIHAGSKTYQSIPSNGKNGQVLMSSNGKGVWADIDVLDLMSYGVSWRATISDPKLTRIGNMSYHKTLPIQSSMKGCIYNPVEKRVIYWLGETDWRFRKEPVYKTVSFNGTSNVTFEEEDFADTLAEGQFVRVDTGFNTYIGKIDYCGGSEAAIIWEAGDNIEEDFSTITQLEIGSRLDGYDGEVMVYVPEFYIKSYDGKDTDPRRWVRISPTKIDDTWEHQPAVFIGAYRDTVLNTVPENMGYLSTLEVNTAISVANTAAYCRGGNNSAANDTSDDVFRRQLGKCRTALSRATFREYTRKAGKEIMSYRQYKNILYWLWVIEYATFDSQASFNAELTAEGFHQGGMGIGLTTMDKWKEYNGSYPIAPNGYTNEFGNGTGVKDLVIPEFTYGAENTVRPAQTLKPFGWRGLEDTFGGAWLNVDGVIIDADADNHPNNMNYVYTTDDPTKYGDTVADIANMVLSGLEVHQNGYTKEWDLGTTAEIIPRIMGESVTQYKCDYHNTGSKNKVLRMLQLSGRAQGSSMPGLGIFSSYESVSASSSNFSFRSVIVANK